MTVQMLERSKVQVVALQGRLDAHQGKQVETLLGAAVHPGGRLVVNLSKVHFVDSTGLAVLVKGMKQQREQQGELVLCELQQPVRIIFELTKLDKMFTLYSTERDALQALQ